MKHSVSRFSFSLSAAWLFALGVLLFADAPAGAQLTFVSTYSFNNTDGAYPDAALVFGSDGNFYGTAAGAGANGDGTVFKVTPAGALTTLVTFNGANGANPQAALTEGRDGDFYGTTKYGGDMSGSNPNGYGTVFKVTPAGVLTTLYSFTNGTDGAYPGAALTQGSDGNLYGTTQGGGTSGGTVFKVTPAEVFTTLVTFNYSTNGSSLNSLIEGRDGNFYGTASTGGSASEAGTVFKVTPAGALTTLVTFNGANGANPEAALVLGADGNFYGTTGYGGAGNGGTVFKVTPSGALTTLVTFNGTNGYNPTTALVLGRDGNFYGTTSTGGGLNGSGSGTVFQVTPAGMFTLLYSFPAGGDGAHPSGLVLGTDGNFYGTTQQGGAKRVGTVFEVTPAGALTTIYTFNFPNGADPSAALVQGRDGDFYGTTSGGGGTVFKVTSAGALTTLYSFKAGTDGANPEAALVLGSDGNFYGTTSAGGDMSGNNPNGYGTVFKVTPSGALTTLVTFNGTDGAYPIAALVLGGDGNFYGTTASGGANGNGTVFKMTPTGGLTTLVTFNGTNGQYPSAALILGGDGNFYGTTQQGGASFTSTNSGYGIVFQVTPAGGLTTLHSFNNTDGASPEASLVLGGDGNFYGTTYGGSTSFEGTVFKVTPAGGLTTLHSFNYTDGASPEASLVLGGDGNFYGTATNGGASSQGTVFKVTPAGALTTLVSFDSTDGSGPSSLIEGSDGNFYGTTFYGGSGGIGTIFGLFGPPATYGASETTNENTPVSFTVAFDDPSSKGVTSIAFPTQPTHGTLTVGAITEPGTTGTVALTYTPDANSIGGDSFTYTVTGYVGTSAPQTVTLAINPPAPTITSFAPASGPVGTTVTITGTHLNGATLVGFRAKHAASFTVNSTGTQITTTVPAGADTGQTAVLTPGGEAKSTTDFTVIKPVITGFSPASGAVGTIVTIMGTNLTGVTKVGFQGAHATTFAVNTAGTQITATVPTGAATGPVAVMTATGTAKSTANFTVH